MQLFWLFLLLPLVDIMIALWVVLAFAAGFLGGRWSVLRAIKIRW